MADGISLLIIGSLAAAMALVALLLAFATAATAPELPRDTPLCGRMGAGVFIPVSFWLLRAGVRLCRWHP